MNNSMHIEHPRSVRRRGFPAWSLVLAVVIGAGSVAVNAQSTTGHVFGMAPAGQTITAKSTTNGLNRHVKVDDKGRYTLGALPVGVYTVTLEKDGHAVEQRSNVKLVVGRGINIDFTCPQGGCAQSTGNE
ncbi:carboxypeptidase-like regulatory domain-containing protein [Rhodanobacter thiooxydans]|uniref:carboxypeptidase-like regulatory domain-containing protein n=1 Tax=Rhodanobacter thiooxydans TaxID=416169 RepID=UPI000D343A66|nr:carboxypeptidase-like regulatory domain-containing protein [Rhodanobacter thiooxydans]